MNVVSHLYVDYFECWIRWGFDPHHLSKHKIGKWAVLKCDHGIECLKENNLLLLFFFFEKNFPAPPPPTQTKKNSILIDIWHIFIENIWIIRESWTSNDI